MAHGLTSSQPPSRPSAAASTGCVVSVTLLDGPTGTELARRGVRIDGPGWSARAIREAPDVLRAIHADYAGAGATVHTAATFRTRPGDVGEDWRELAARTVDLARSAVPAWHRIAGSLGPVADCYDRAASPGAASFDDHARVAHHLAALGVDLLLLETFAEPAEAVAATRAAAAAGPPVWIALTPGFQGDLLDPGELSDAARRCVAAGASAVLVNCGPAETAERWLAALAGLGAAVGVYANAGPLGGGLGWDDGGEGPARYLALARDWVARGASIVGGCCGTRPGHVRALRLAGLGRTGPSSPAGGDAPARRL